MKKYIFLKVVSQTIVFLGLMLPMTVSFGILAFGSGTREQNATLSLAIMNLSLMDFLPILALKIYEKMVEITKVNFLDNVTIKFFVCIIIPFAITLLYNCILKGFDWLIVLQIFITLILGIAYLIGIGQLSIICDRKAEKILATIREENEEI